MEADLTAVVHSLTLKTTDVAGNAANGSSRAVIGTEGADNLAGSTGNDITFGSGGNDRMTGGAGGDVFVFRVGFGNDVITDFTVTNAPGVLHDTLAFDHNVFADIAAVMSHSAQVGANVVISLDANNSITLQNVALSTLSTQIDDFFFF
jgi:Ca2+-binding RTX toxin-like protein